MNSKELKRTARQTGLIYLLLAITAATGLAYVPSQVVVKNNMAVTVKNLIDKEGLVRLGIYCHLASQVLFIFLVLFFYKLLSPVHKSMAKAMVLLVMAQVPIIFILETINMAGLMVAKGEVMASLTPAAREEMVGLLINIRSEGIGIVEIFWGLWLIPLGMLFYKSGFMPRVSGVLLILGGIAYIIESGFNILNLPAYKTVVQFTPVCYAVAELTAILWLLIFGIKKQVVFNGQ